MVLSNYWGGGGGVSASVGVIVSTKVSYCVVYPTDIVGADRSESILTLCNEKCDLLAGKL